jgi:hypothetical protein
VTGLKDTWITRALQGISEGDRNDIGYKLASHFKNSQPIDITESLMLEWNKKNKPPLDKHELIATIRSAYKNPPLNNPPLKTPPLPSPPPFSPSLSIPSPSISIYLSIYLCHHVMSYCHIYNYKVNTTCIG